MESWRQTLAQLRNLVNGMAPGQRLTLIAVPLLVLALLGLSTSFRFGADEVPLGGRTFTAAESRKAQETLRKAGLGDFRVDGERILVPGTDAARYLAALPALPARLTWKDHRGTTRFASVVTRNVSDLGVYVESRSVVSIPLYRLVQFQLETDARESDFLDMPRRARANRTRSPTRLR